MLNIFVRRVFLAGANRRRGLPVGALALEAVARGLDFLGRILGDTSYL
jgi:hypothetical protein